MAQWVAGRAALRLLAATLATTAVACGQPATEATGDGDAVPPSPPVSAGDPSSRLSTRLSDMPGEPAARRNLFRFGSAPAGRVGSGRSNGGEELPELPLPLPRPAIRVLGVASDGGSDGTPIRRTAILSVGGELVLAPEGATVAGRYRVLAIGERDVQLVDEIDQHIERFALR